MPVELSWHGRVLRVALNRPEKRNALNAEMCRKLLQAFETAEAGAILLVANGSVFSSGMDLTETSAPELPELHERLFTRIHGQHTPIVAAVQGAALGGGTGVVANAHIVIAGQGARFGLTEIRIGLWPVLIFRAVALAVGERRAMELSLTGRIIDAQQALEYGLVDEIVMSPEKRAMQIAQEIASHSPVAIAAGLEYVQQIHGTSWEEAGVIGQRMRERLLASPDFAEGVKAFFEKRPPQWPSILKS